jgi:hypothetical protein
MSIPNSTGMKRKPSHPGEMLREDFLPDMTFLSQGWQKRSAYRANRSTSCCASAGVAELWS